MLKFCRWDVTYWGVLFVAGPLAPVIGAAFLAAVLL